jgi:hypothetical protein
MYKLVNGPQGHNDIAKEICRITLKFPPGFIYERFTRFGKKKYSLFPISPDSK